MGPFSTERLPAGPVSAVRATQSEPLVPLLELETKGGRHPKLAKAFERVRRALKHYARATRTGYEELTLGDVSDGRGRLSPAFTEFLEGLKPFTAKQRSPEEREAGYPLLREYQEQVRSGLRAIIEHFSGTDAGRRKRVPERDELPEFLLPVWDALPKVEGRPTDSAGILLLALMAVVDRYGLDEYEPLFSDLTREVRLALRDEEEDASRWDYLEAQHSEVKGRLGLRSSRSPVRQDPIRDFPEPLKSECALFRKRAVEGVEDAALLDRAREKKVNLERRKPDVVRTMLYTLRAAMEVIKPAEPFGIRDLMGLEEVEIEEEGQIRKQKRSRPVDIFRAQQRDLESPTKRVTYDSVQFDNFLIYIKTVANYNGLFRLREEFSGAYGGQNGLRLDTEKQQQKRDEKKEAYPREWLDSEVQRLGIEFRRIVRARSFDPGHDGLLSEEQARDVRLCLFYLAFVTLRHLGLRQQALRKLSINESGWNVRFEGGGKAGFSKITFHWRAKEVKNKRPVTLPLVKGRHQATHGPLFEAYELYYRRVYPFIQRREALPLDGQLLAMPTLNGTHGRFRGLDKCTHQDFAQFFQRAGREFLRRKQRSNGQLWEVNPHFMRAAAADWLWNFGLTTGEIAALLAIEEDTLKEHYLDPNIGPNTAPILDRLNALADGAGRDERVEEMKGVIANLRETYELRLAQKDDDLRAMDDRLKRAEERAGKLESDLDASRLQVEGLRTELQAKTESHNRELKELIRAQSPAAAGPGPKPRRTTTRQNTDEVS